VDDLYAKPSAVCTEEAARILLGLNFACLGMGSSKLYRKRCGGVGAILGMARKMPRELYLVSVHTDSANVKVREGLLDIKIKVGETPEGYEIFQPAVSSGFPWGKRISQPPCCILM